MADHAEPCTYSWCTAHATACTCPYSDVHPHRRDGCRYAPDTVPITKRTGKPAGRERAR